MKETNKEKCERKALEYIEYCESQGLDPRDTKNFIKFFEEKKENNEKKKKEKVELIEKQKVLFKAICDYTNISVEFKEVYGDLINDTVVSMMYAIKLIDIVENDDADC